MSRVGAQRPRAWRPKITEDDVCLEVVSVEHPSGRKGAGVSSGGCFDRREGGGRGFLLRVAVLVGEKRGVLWEGERKGKRAWPGTQTSRPGEDLL